MSDYFARCEAQIAASKGRSEAPERIIPMTPDHSADAGKMVSMTAVEIRALVEWPTWNRQVAPAGSTACCMGCGAIAGESVVYQRQDHHPDCRIARRNDALEAFAQSAEALARVRQYCHRVLAAPTTEYEFNVGKDTVAQSVLDELALLPSGSPEAVPAKEKP